MTFTKEQVKKLHALWTRNNSGYLSFDTFVDSFGPDIGYPKTAMTTWCGMVLGIEPDGHSHT